MWLQVSEIAYVCMGMGCKSVFSLHNTLLHLSPLGGWEVMKVTSGVISTFHDEFLSFSTQVSEYIGGILGGWASLLQNQYIQLSTTRVLDFPH